MQYSQLCREPLLSRKDFYSLNTVRRIDDMYVYLDLHMLLLMFKYLHTQTNPSLIFLATGAKPIFVICNVMYIWAVHVQQ